MVCISSAIVRIQLMWANLYSKLKSCSMTTKQLINKVSYSYVAMFHLTFALEEYLL